MNSVRLIVSLGLAALVAACGQERTNPPDVPARVVNAAPSYLTLFFMRERNEEATVDYGGVSGGLIFDEDTYDFTVNYSTPADGVVAGTTSAHTMTDGMLTYFVLVETSTGLEIVPVDEPVFPRSSSNAEVTFFHAARALGDVDVYFEAPGADLAAATPRAGLGFLDGTDPATVPPGDYVLTLTQPGSPANEVYRTAVQTTSAGQDNFFTIIDGANIGPAAARVVRVNETPTLLVSPAAPVLVRAVNAAADRAARDVYLDDDFAAPLFDDLAYASDAGFAAVGLPGPHAVTVTPADSTGVLELDEDRSFTPDAYHQYVFAGDSNGLSAVLAAERPRAIEATARVSVINAATQFEELEFLVVSPGTDLDDASSQLRLGAPAAAQASSLAPGDYEIALRDLDTGTIVYGPTPISFAARDVVTIVSVNGPDATSAELLLLENFTPP